VNPASGYSLSRFIESRTEKSDQLTDTKRSGHEEYGGESKTLIRKQ
jgi:hypothetical protein